MALIERLKLIIGQVEVACPARACRRAGRVVFAIGPDRDAPAVVAKTPHYRRWPMFGEAQVAKQITATQMFPLTLKVTDKKGNPARIDGKPEWFTTNTDVLALEPSEDGMTCMVKAVGPMGVADVQATADADLGEGVKPIIATAAVEVVAGEATVVTLDDTAPAVEQPDTPPADPPAA